MPDTAITGPHMKGGWRIIISRLEQQHLEALNVHNIIVCNNIYFLMLLFSGYYFTTTKL